jgi:hypothetical protein
MEHLCQFRMGHACRLAAERSHTADGGIIERVPKRVSSDHARGADDDEPLPRVGGCHDNRRSSIQSTYSKRSENSHAPSALTNVS